MMVLTKKDIDCLSVEVSNLIKSNNISKAVISLKKVLDVKCPFVKLDALGKSIGQAGLASPRLFFKAFEAIVDYNAMGSYVVVANGLVPFLETKFDLVMEKTHQFIVKGDVWHVCDNMAERSLGYALVNYFDKTLPYLKKFLLDDNRWIKRAVGVAIHFFSKRVVDQPDKTLILLKLVESHIEVSQRDVVKGIGWGLKTIGKHHPDFLTGFLLKQLNQEKKLSSLMLKKALTYLPDKDKLKLTNAL